jgi:hypothetical protein
MDNLNRLLRAKEGHWDGSTVTDGNAKRDEVWTLDQTGNWELFKRDLDGDLNYTDALELKDRRTHNVVNELLTRDIDDNSSVNFTLVYDDNGNLTDDGEQDTYEYDPFRRLRPDPIISPSTFIPTQPTSSGRLSSWDLNQDLCRQRGTSAMLKTTLANCPPENLSPVSAHSTLSGPGRGLTARKAFDFPRGTRRFHEKTPKRSTLGAWKRSWWDSNEHICRHSCTSAMLETTLANCPPREPVARFGPQDALWDGARSDRAKTARLSAKNSPLPQKNPEAEYARGLEAELVGFE